MGPKFGQFGHLRKKGGTQPDTFHESSWLVNDGILRMVYYNAYITGVVFHPLYTLNNQGPFFHGPHLNSTCPFWETLESKDPHPCHKSGYVPGRTQLLTLGINLSRALITGMLNNGYIRTPTIGLMNLSPNTGNKWEFLLPQPIYFWRLQGIQAKRHNNPHKPTLDPSTWLRVGHCTWRINGIFQWERTFQGLS